MKNDADLVVTGIGQLLTCAGPGGEGIGLIPDAMLAVRKGKIVAAGKTRDLEGRIRSGSKTRVISAGGRPVVPGFVDCHTHMIFAGWRAGEFERRLAGASYSEIAAAGGGIVSTVAATRAASEASLLNLAKRRAGEALAHGTTTLEVKSGYGLSTAAELKMLRVARKLGEERGPRIVATFLGAHTVPPEWRHDPDGYVNLVCREMIPAVAKAKLAIFCDVFCERGAFTPAQTRRIFAAAKKNGLVPRLHADQLSDSGGASLASACGASSADHLVHASASGLRAMAKAGVPAVLLPTSTFFLRMKEKTPVAEMREAGVMFALGTDCNPGTSPVLSMQTAMRFAVLHYGLTPAEALVAATRGSAKALRLDREVGSLTPGRSADFLILDAPDWRHLVYELDRNVVRAIVRGGRGMNF